MEGIPKATPEPPLTFMEHRLHTPPWTWAAEGLYLSDFLEARVGDNHLPVLRA